MVHLLTNCLTETSMDYKIQNAPQLNLDGNQSPDLDLSLVSAERQADAVKQRAEQLKRWQNSDTSLPSSGSSALESRVKFDAFECFIDAVKKNDLEYVWSFIRSGKDVNGPIVDGLTAIHQAVLCSSLEMIKLLVESDANVNVKDVYGWTPLHASVYTKDTEIVRYLLEKGADPLCVNIDLEFPVDICEQLWTEEDVSSSSRFRLREIKKVLVAAIGETDVDSVRDSEKSQMLEDTKFLLDNQDRPVPVCSENSTPLHVAASKGYMDVLSLLVQLHNLDINARDSDGWTALHAALFFEQDKAAELLMMAGASIHQTTKMNETMEDVCSDEMLEVFNDLKNQRPNYGSGVGSIGKRRLSFPIRALRAGSIDQKDRDNERMILEQRGSESLSLEDSPEFQHRSFSDTHLLSGPMSTTQTPRPTALNSGNPLDSTSESLLSRATDRQEASGKYLHYGLKNQSLDTQRKSSYPSQTSKADKGGYREVASTKYQRPSLPSNGTANVTTRRVRSDVDIRTNGPAPLDTSQENLRSLVPPPGKPASGGISKIQRPTPLSSSQSDSIPSSDSPSYSRNTSEIARKTGSRKSLDGRRKTQPVDQDVLNRAMEEYSSSVDTVDESTAGENGSEEVAPTGAVDTSSSQETPSRTETRFRINKVPSKESTGPDSLNFTASERRVPRDSPQTHGTGGRLYSDIGRSPSQTREQRPWPPTINRVSAIIGNFEKSGPAPAHAPAGSSSGSAVSLDAFALKDETGGAAEKAEQSKELTLTVPADESSPANLRRDRPSYSSTSRKMAKQRRSTGISQDDVMDCMSKESMEASEEIPVTNIHTPNSHFSNATGHVSTPYNYHSHAPQLSARGGETHTKTTEPSKYENDSKTSLIISHSRYNSKEERTNNDSNFYKKLYEQEQTTSKRVQDELNQLRIQKEVWEQDQGSCKRLQDEITQIKIDRELDIKDKVKSEKYISQMNRRLSDTTRAYEQEKKERTRLDLKLQQLQFAEQRIHQVEAEKQRSEDENKKLIEVIKSLSGTSF